MTRKHFEMVAQAVNETRQAFDDASVTGEALDHLADRLAEEFRSENPRFDKARFLTACGCNQPA